MAKHRKTRKEKKLADSRHKFTYDLATATPGEVKLTIKADRPLKEIKTKQTITSIDSYPYLVKDLSKTGLLTASILAFQIVLFFLIKNHTITIPGLNY